MVELGLPPCAKELFRRPNPTMARRIIYLILKEGGVETLPADSEIQNNFNFLRKIPLTPFEKKGESHFRIIQTDSF